MDPTVATEKGGSYIDDDDEDEEKDVCRICRNLGDANNPLRYPCACSGSIKFVHLDCLNKWLIYRRNSRRCEVCKHPFSSSPVYAENAPTILPFHEFVLGTVKKARRCRTLRLFPRLCFRLSVTLLSVHFVTFWIWRFAFVRSFGEAQRLFVSHISTTAILTDCLLGSLLSACRLLIFKGATSLRDYLRELGGQEEREDEGERNGVRAARRPPGEGNGEVAGDQGAAVGGAQDRHVPFYQLVGIPGPVFRFVKKVFTTVARNVLFVGVVIFVPFTLGRVILYHVSWRFTARVPAVTGSMHLIDTGLSLLTSVSNLTNEGQENGLLGQLTDMIQVNGNGANNTLSLAADLMKGSVAKSSKLSDATTLIVGYMFIVFLVFLYLGIIALIRDAKGEPLTVGKVYGIAAIVKAVPSLLRPFLPAMRLGSFYVVVVLGISPLMYGWWLDVCTVRMFGKIMSHRVQFLSVSPLASLLVHWVVGAMYALQVNYIICLLGKVLRPGVLYFLIDPEDTYATFRGLIDVPVHKLAREVLLEYAIDGSLTVILVFLPVKLAIWMAPSIFPLDIS
ncbi:unnamed protein product [Microthlaspi erraticum]|uniref:RING-type E3 ubiquitin transferase n=1 Tax=Microthlaspi erraticum TaxID=1685480 RepID=A0A6D2INY0_9BRAS|nr:unnamed protein product [Microthlaspi erraticum]CAA7029353.1 unnamed protein product [Microthlaspi erraticum]